MPAKATAGVIAEQQHDEHPEGMFLEIGAGIGRMSLFVKAAFIADADAMGIPAFGMRTRLPDGAKRLYVTVPADIKMITCAGEAPAQVVCSQVMFRVATVGTRSGTVDDDKID